LWRGDFVFSLIEGALWLRLDGALQIPLLRSPEFPIELVGVGEVHTAFSGKAAHVDIVGFAK
jgi:hypothetical protein